MPSVRKRVLTADPVSARRESLALFLRNKGIGVIEVPDGGRALTETLLQKPDLLLLDLAAPILPPERLIQILRNNPNTREMPVFFFCDQEKNVAGFRPGIDQFIQRPIQEEEVFQRIQRLFHKNPVSEAFAGDSVVSGNLSQFSIPDLWQMLSMNQKSGILQIEGENTAGSIYIERGDIVSASMQNLTGEKALFRMIPLKKGKFRFLPKTVEVRKTVFIPSQHAILEGMRHHDELKRIDLPAPGDTVEVVSDAKGISPEESEVHEALMLAGFCSSVEEVVNNCHFPDLVVYRALLSLKEKGILRIGRLEKPELKKELLSKENFQLIPARLLERNPVEEEGGWRIVFFIPDPGMIDDFVQSLGKYRDFEVDKTFFSLRRKEGFPMGVFGRLRLAWSGSILLSVLPYQHSISPLWFSLAPDPVGIVVFLKSDLTGSLENLMAVSEFAQGTSTRALLAVTDEAFAEFGLRENTLKLFRNHLERISCTLEVRRMEKVTPEWIRECLLSVLRQSPKAEGEV